MELRKVEWQEQGYHLMLVEAYPCRFHLLVSRDRREYAIYDRFHAPNIRAARESIRFNPYFYEAVSPAFPITREAAMAGETGIPDSMDVWIRHMESNWPGVTLRRN
ncbi:MAG: hypothetical protein Q8O86_00625 [Dehalococcoidia bacterium]|nr:hypothetical protein [Dehalococcoidia bacterium]